MIVMKFGGTSVQDAERILRAVQIVEQHRDRRPVVVLSAVAGVTRDLLALGHDALDGGPVVAGRRLRRILDLHQSIADDLDLDAEARRTVGAEIAGHFDELEQTITGVSLVGQYTPRTQDAIMSLGERLSTRLFAAAATAVGLDVVLVDAASILITDDRHREARPNRTEVEARARATLVPLADRGKIPVTQGFIGATADGVPTTMGFESSDYSASLVGAALDATEIQIWTDVPGMLTTGNRAVSDVMTVRTLSFEEAAELSFFGAKVLHPCTIAPAVEKSIPVRILPSRNSSAAGTTIDSRRHAEAAVKSIAVKADVAVARLDPREPMTVHGALQTIIETLDRHEASPHLFQAAGSRVVVVAADTGTLHHALAELAPRFSVGLDADCVVVSLVGDGLGESGGLVTRAVHALRDTQLHMISYGPSSRSASVVVAADAENATVAALHEEFFGADRPTDLFQPACREERA